MSIRKNYSLLICMLLIVSLLLTACGNKNENEAVKSTSGDQSTALETTDHPAESIVSTDTQEVVSATTPSPIPIVNRLSDEQRNSIGMLNYLTMLTQEINTSKNSRLYLESVYSYLVNNTYPNAVDQETEFRLEEILEQLNNYRMNAVKRERLEFIYERNKAMAIREAVPNPLGLLSSVRSFSWPQLIASVAYMAVDSVTSYQNASSQAELEYLQDGWELDDAEYETLHKLRSRAFTYMIEMVNSNDLPGDLALNEKSVENYVEWKLEENVVRRIQLLEANQNVYEGFGPYWLTLAESYFINKDYQKCMDAISTYESLSTRIFRQDFELAKVLPSALLSAMEILDGKEYVAIAKHYLEQIEDNAAFDDWSLRYFAAQGYIDLYQRTSEISYLKKAYDLTLNNATILVSEQQKLNDKYTAEVQKIDIPKGTTKEKKDELEKLNKQAEEERKIALIPVYEPLTLNCDLLFSIAEELEVPIAEQVKIESILHHNNQPLFLVPSIDSRYWFADKATLQASEIKTAYDNGSFTIPVQYVTDTAVINLRITSDNEVTDISDWTLSNVTRNDKSDLSTFTASFSSSAASKYKFKANDQLVFTVLPTGDDKDGVYDFKFIAEEKTDWIVHRFLVYTRAEVNE